MRSRSFWTGIWIRSHTQTAAERVFRFQCRILVEETENLMQEMEENNVGIKEND